MNPGIKSLSSRAKPRDLVPVSDEISRQARNDNKILVSCFRFIFSISLFLFSFTPAWAVEPAGEQAACNFVDNRCSASQCLNALDATQREELAQRAKLLPACAFYEGTLYSRQCGCRNINELVRFIINYGNFVIGVVGAIALLMFIYGGVVILTAAGGAERVGQGKKAIVAAVIGLVIVFGAQLIVRFTLSTLRAREEKSLQIQPEPTQNQK